MITSLSEEQRASFRQELGRWKQIMEMKPNKVNAGGVKEAVEGLTGAEGIVVHVVDNPVATIEAASDAAGKNMRKEYVGLIYVRFNVAYDRCMLIPGVQVGEDMRRRLDLWTQLVLSTGGFVRHGNTVWAHPYPKELLLDEGGQPHAEHGPALSWEGLHVYFWHGIQIPGEWIENRATLDPAEAFKITNLETRRCFCEIVGWEKLIDGLSPSVLDMRKNCNGDTERLLEVDLPDVGRCRFLDVICGTGRRFVLDVPVGTRTVLDGQAILHDVPKEVIEKMEVRA